MGLRQIRLRGDELLAKKAKPVKSINAGVLTLLDDMLETLRERDGLGLAAPQVGVLKRVAVIEYEDKIYELINPEIVETEGTQTSVEACLSVPGQAGDIQRPMKITVSATNREGQVFSVCADGFLASIFCHEIDHLDGLLFIDRATNVQFINREELLKRREVQKKEQ